MALGSALSNTESHAGSFGPFLEHLNSLGISVATPVACPLAALKQYHSQLSQELSVPDLSKPGKTIFCGCTLSAWS